MGKRTIIYILLWGLIVANLMAQQVGNGTERAWWQREQLSGDWGGWRTSWAERGVTFSIDYTAEILANVSGGLRRGAEYEGLGEFGIDVDLGEFANWKGGAFRVSTLWTHGSSPSSLVGDEFAVSNIDAFDSIRLYELWLEQNFWDEHYSLRIGNLLADEEFAGTEYGAVFYNAAFGQPAFWANNTLNTGPAFNVAGLGVRLRYDVTDSWYAQAGVYDGDTFDSADGDPGKNKNGVHFQLGNGQGWASLYEFGYNGFNVDDGSGLPGWYRVGVWRHSAEFTNHDNSKSNGIWGLYGAVDQMLLREQDDQGLGVFFRYGIAPRNRSRFHWVLDTGLNYKGLLPGRDEDVAALGIVYGKHSSEIATTKSHETALEATYLIQVTPGFYLQPDIQWINRPSGDSSIKDAWVFGLRAGFTF